MKNQQKGFIEIVLIGVIVVLLAIGGYFAFRKNSAPVVEQPTPNPAPIVTQTNTPVTTPATADETANWKTYTNSQYGFELKYPSTWLSKVLNGNTFFNLPDDKVENGKGGVESSIHDDVSVSVDNSKKYNSLSDLEDSLSLKSDPNWNDSSISQKMIGNNNFLVYGWMHQGQGVDYFTLVNGNSLEIRFEMDDTILAVEQSKNYSDFLEFLTTLKFTK